MANTKINSQYNVYFDNSDSYNPFITSECNLYYNADMTYFSYGCKNLVFNLDNDTILHDKVTNMAYAYYNCWNLVGSPVCGNNVTDMNYTYYNCSNLTGSPVCGPNVTAMYRTYYNCYNLIGSPACGNNVTYIYDTYGNCTNLTGNAVFSPKCYNKDSRGVLNSVYYNCVNLTGIEIPDTWTNMANFADNCSWYHGTPGCGNNVTNMTSAYENCINISGSPVCGNNVTNIGRAYRYCPNIYGDMYCYNSAAGSINMWGCFYGRNTQNRLNIHITMGSKFDTTLLNKISQNGWIYGIALEWTSTDLGYYNAEYNTYIYNRTEPAIILSDFLVGTSVTSREIIYV